MYKEEDEVEELIYTFSISELEKEILLEVKVQ
jgi:hypothetical protein